MAPTAATLSYHAPQDRAKLFWDAQQSVKYATPQVPVGFPQRLDSDLAWTKESIERRRHEWFVDLDEQDIAALESTLAKWEANGLCLTELSPETFPLPSSLAERFRSISKACYKGIGFQIVRGLNPDHYTATQNAIISAGIAAHVAPQRGFLDRNREKVLCHVVNASNGKDSAPTQMSRSPGFTNASLSFHSDNCEILSLYALNLASEGGKTLIASSWQLYNDLAACKPEVLQELAEHWVLDTFQDYSKHPPVKTPLLHNVDGERAIFRFSRYPMTGFMDRTRNSSLPPLTQAQADASEAVQFMAAANAIPLPMEKGNMVFLNDMALLHAREKFDEGGVYLGRHLLKMYLRDPEHSWPIPESMADYWERIYQPNWNGVNKKEIWNIEYTPGQEADWRMNG